MFYQLLKMKKLFYTILFLLIANFVFAQNPFTPPGGANKITGKNYYTDSIAFIKYLNSPTMDSVLAVDRTGKLIQVEMGGSGPGTQDTTISKYPLNTLSKLASGSTYDTLRILGIVYDSNWFNVAHTIQYYRRTTGEVDTLVRMIDGSTLGGALTVTNIGTSGPSILTGNILNIPIYGGGGGSGTVTDFSAGNLSPLFTTNVATSTSTPALTFSLSNAGAYTLFGRAASTGAPSFLTSIDSLWIPALHSQTYYDLRYGQLSRVWGTLGNAGTNGAINYIGTSDFHPLILSTNGIERVRLDSNSNNAYFKGSILLPTSEVYGFNSSAHTGLAYNGSLYTEIQNYGTGFQFTTLSSTLMYLTPTAFTSTSPLTIGSLGIANSSSIAEFISTTQGLLMPRGTTTNRDAIAAPATMLQFSNTTTGTNNTYNGTNWVGSLIVSSAGTLTLKHGEDYVFTGTTATYTLPAVSSSTVGSQNGIKIKNRGSGSITLNSNTGSTIYNTAAQSTITITAGSAVQLLPDGTYFNVL